MKKTAIICMLIIFGALLTSLFWDETASIDLPPPTDSKGIYTTELPNGLTITIKEVHALPLVSIQFWIKVGSRYEPKGKEGIAHIFEHIWFKGTKTQPVGSFHKLVESLGGELNAATSYDWTMYYVDVPADRFDKVFPKMVDLLRNPAFDEKEIKKEEQVILEEQRMNYNQPERAADVLFSQSLIQHHPYGKPIIGYPDTIPNITREELINFYNTHYTPNNINVIVVGDVDPDKAEQKITEQLGDMTPRTSPQLNLPKEPQKTKTTYNSRKRNFGQIYFTIGTQAPRATDTKRYTFEVLNTIFSQGEASRLQLIKQKNLIVEGESVAIPLNDLGIFETIAVIDPKKRNNAATEIITQLNKFKTEPVSKRELSRAKKYIRAKRAKTQERIKDSSMQMGEEWVYGTLEEYPKYLKNIEKVTAQDIQEAANQYFKAYTIAEIKP